MALVLDTGPLYASLDRDDSWFQSSVELLKSTTEPLVVPAPVLVELDWLVHTRLHAGVFLSFLDDVTAGAFRVEGLTPSDYQRARDLCDRYSSAGIGFVDAAVLAVVERLGEPKLATLDHLHFQMMRPRHVEVLQLLP